MKLWQIAAVSVAAGITLPAIAQMGQPSTRAEVEARVKERLGKFDANKDGTVTPDELRGYAEAQAKVRADDHFTMMDTNKDGSVSRAEYDAWVSKRPARMINGEPMIHVLQGGPEIVMLRPPAPPAPPEGAAPPKPGDAPQVRREIRIITADGDAPPPPGPDGKRRERHEIRIMSAGDGHMPMMWSGDGKGIVIADAVKKALERFDAMDTNKDGTISPEERKAAHGEWRGKVG